MGIYVAVIVGMVIWIVGFALLPSPHANFDWFMPLPVIVLLAFVAQRAGPWLRKTFRS